MATQFHLYLVSTAVVSVEAETKDEALALFEARKAERALPGYIWDNDKATVADVQEVASPDGYLYKN
jgi:hypothetical protein